MGFGQYLKTKDFWRQILWMLLITIVLVSITLLSLGIFTRHGKEIKVADITGLKTEQLEPYSREFGFRFVVRDSVYQADAEPGTVLSQSPLPGAIVKKGRTFYLVVAAAHPASERMPDLRDLSLRQAASLLETYGLKVGKVIEVPQVVKGSVVRQLYGGEVIEPGSPIRKGSYIDLEIGNGKGKWKTEEEADSTAITAEEDTEDYEQQ